MTQAGDRGKSECSSREGDRRPKGGHRAGLGVVIQDFEAVS